MKKLICLKCRGIAPRFRKGCEACAAKNRKQIDKYKGGVAKRKHWRDFYATANRIGKDMKKRDSYTHCSICMRAKDPDYFPGHRCQNCSENEVDLGRNVVKISSNRARELKSRYGTSVKEMRALIEKQDYCCAICGTGFGTSRDFHVDHCHKSGKVRGVLCGNCNMGLGQFKDNQLALRQAIEYLKAND